MLLSLVLSSRCFFNLIVAPAVVLVFRLFVALSVVVSRVVVSAAVVAVLIWRALSEMGSLRKNQTRVGRRGRSGRWREGRACGKEEEEDGTEDEVDL